MRELEYPFDSEYMRKKKRKIKKDLLTKNKSNLITKKIAVLGGSTTDEIRDMLELFLLNYGIEPIFYISEYNKYYEDGRFDNPELRKFSPDIVYIHTSYRNITALPLPSDTEETVQAKLKTMTDKFTGLWENIRETYHSIIIQNNFEMPFYRLLGNQDVVYHQGCVNFVCRLNIFFSEYALANDNFFIHDINYESACYGLEKWSDPLYWHLYKYAMAIPAVPYTAYGIALIIKSIYGKNKKALSLDLDNTLWGGVIGDDGAEGIEIGQETAIGQTYNEFQNYLKQLKSIGVLLTVNSKNTESTAREGFKRPDSVLKEDDFIDFKANWEPKNMNLSASAQMLNLLPESFVFIDDNPAEREIIKQSFTGVEAPNIGQPEHYINTIDHAGYFEITTLSRDDLERNAMYEANAKRLSSESSFADYGEYLKSLEMEAEIRPFHPMYMSRIAQLTNKSNQFNLTTLRLSQTDIEKMAADSRYVTMYGKLKDKFGDNGVVSVVIGEIRAGELQDGKLHGGELHIILWLMSCRVLKRDMEFAMMEELVNVCKAKGIHKIYGYYYPTAKNAMVSDFYSLQGFEIVSQDENQTIWCREPGCEKKEFGKNRFIKVN